VVGGRENCAQGGNSTPHALRYMAFNHARLLYNKGVDQEEKHAIQVDREVYTLKTAESSNWLERNIHLLDELDLVLLSKNPPDIINLPGDNPEDTPYIILKRFV
jgi:hypothetical protein